MIRAAQARQQRARGVGTGRDIPIPLPLRGLLSEAKSAEVSGSFAGEFLNWESDGTKIKLRGQAGIMSEPSAVLQRIPFEFGSNPRYIEIYADRAVCGDATITREFSASCAVAYISGQAVIADGKGLPVRFDGSAFHTISMTVLGIDPALFDGVVAHQDRLFFWQTGGPLDFWHSATVGGVQGAFSRFPLGRLGNVTGNIAAILSLTMDAGHGMNDTLAVITSTGTIVAYEGLNPADAQDWRQLARVEAAAPTGPEGFARVGADIWMVTAGGIVSVTDSLRRGIVALVSNVSRAVAEEIAREVEQGGRWQIHAAADGARVYVNRITDDGASQFVFHAETQSWSKADHAARAWHNLAKRTEFTDMDGRLRCLQRCEGEDVITARWVSGWFRLPRATALRYLQPTILASGPLTLKVTVLSDHDGTAQDIAQSVQTVTINPDRPGARVALNEVIATDAVGTVYQVQIEVTATWAEMVNLIARVT